MSQSILEWILAVEEEVITREEFAAAMRSGDEALKKETVERMLLAGGYENLEG